MKKNEKKLLSILIPTYNRSKYLDKALKSICEQIDESFISKIEIIISNNCSEDDTDSIVQKYLIKYPVIKYIKQLNNTGVDKNFLFLFKESTGKFGWIFGDDEILLDGALKRILENIKLYPQAGLIHINGYRYLNNPKEIVENKKYETLLYQKKDKYIEAVYQWLTFITANIFNIEYIEKELNYENGVGSNLIQEYFYFQSIFNAKFNLELKGDYYASKAENDTGGYKRITVFSKNYNEIFNFFINRGIDKKYFKIINKKMLMLFFPYYIKIRKNNNPLLKKEQKTFYMLWKIYKHYPEFWIFCIPVYIQKDIGYLISKGISFLYRLIKNPKLIKKITEKLKQKLD
ncbi:MAG: glycosyltransferase family 2 protein [Fusobacteriaceae bacterium]